MAETLTQDEETPAVYPVVPSGLSTAASTLDAGIVWGRIEAYTASRWTAREVVWTVEGEGDWTPPLSPAEVTLAERWTGGDWEEVTLPAGPWGYCLPCEGPWRITANVGDGVMPPPPALEAYRRLAEYIAAEDAGLRPGVASAEITVGDISEKWMRNPAWLGRAMVNSGAADLLRPYRRVR